MNQENTTRTARTLTPEERARRAARREERRYQHNLQCHNLFVTGVLLVVIALFAVINLFVGDKETSANENRSLQQNPKFTVSTFLNGTYFSERMDYFSDQFFARDGWISLKLKEDKLLGRKESEGVYLGSDGYLLAEPDTPDVDALVNTITAINTFAETYPDLKMNMMIVPCAAVVLSDKLPANSPVRDQQADIDAIESNITDTIGKVNVSAALEQHTDEYIYYKTDHHWTSLGAYYAFDAAAPYLGITNPVANYQIYTVSDTFQGTLSSKSGSHTSKDTIQVYEPMDTDIDYCVTYASTKEKSCSLFVSSCLDEKDQYTVFFGGNHSLVEIDTTCNNDRVLLLFKDSYANSFVQFLTSYYEKIIMIDPRYYYDSLETLINSSAITDVLFLYSANTLVTDTSLADTLLSKAPEATSMAGAVGDALVTDETTGDETTDETAEPTETEAVETEAAETETAEATESPEGSETT